MFHPDPLIAFRRLCRLWGGMTLGAVAGPLLHVSAWFALVGIAGAVLMLTTIIPLHRDLTRDLTAAERKAQRKWKERSES
jgi:hypothetical protein